MNYADLGVNGEPEHNTNSVSVGVLREATRLR